MLGVALARGGAVAMRVVLGAASTTRIGCPSEGSVANVAVGACVKGARLPNEYGRGIDGCGVGVPLLGTDIDGSEFSGGAIVVFAAGPPGVV